MAQKASPYVAERVYGLIAVSGFSRFWYFRGQRLFVVLEVSRSTAFRVSGSNAASGFSRLRSYRGHRQIVAMERKKLMTLLYTLKCILNMYIYVKIN